MLCYAMQCNAMQCNVMYVCIYITIYIHIYIYIWTKKTCMFAVISPKFATSASSDLSLHSRCWRPNVPCASMSWVPRKLPCWGGSGSANRVDHGHFTGLESNGGEKCRWGLIKIMDPWKKMDGLICSPWKQHVRCGATRHWGTKRLPMCGKKQQTW